MDGKDDFLHPESNPTGQQQLVALMELYTHVCILLCTCRFCVDICLLYTDGYREPAEPRPCRKQTNPPSIPISQLYPDKSFPFGLVMPYTVSDGYCHNTYVCDL